MKKAFLFTIILIALLSLTMHARFGSVEVKASDGVDPAKIYGVNMLWNTSMLLNDIAVSKDGNYIAVANYSGLYYFAYNDSSPRWWYLPPSAAISVAISANGNHTVIGLSSGHLYYFANATARMDDQSAPTWTSYSLGGAVERGSMDISDDGEYVAAGGTGYNVFYYANCTQREGSDQVVTWGHYLSNTEILTVDLSPDGRYLALGGINYSSSYGFVAYYKDANVEPYPTAPYWSSWNSTETSIIASLAVSDDGYGVVATGYSHLTLYYWADATMLTGNPNATWTTDGSFFPVDMSADGDKIVAGTSGPIPVGSLHFWSDARSHLGNQTEDWVKLESAEVLDAAISDDGNVIAASTRTGESNYTAYFLWSNGTIIDEFSLNQSSPIVSMSGDGRITAMGGPGWDSLYVFELLVDDNPPVIEDVYQVPTSDNVYSNSSVAVYANVTDDYSGVKLVILSYTTDNETWSAIDMTVFSGNKYNGTIPQHPYCTTVRYIITATDSCDNTITTEEMGYEYKYHVIPEFALQTVLPLLIMTILLTIILRKRKNS